MDLDTLVDRLFSGAMLAIMLGAVGAAGYWLYTEPEALMWTIIVLGGIVVIYLLGWFADRVLDW